MSTTEDEEKGNDVDEGDAGKDYVGGVPGEIGGEESGTDNRAKEGAKTIKGLGTGGGSRENIRIEKAMNT